MTVLSFHWRDLSTSARTINLGFTSNLPSISRDRRLPMAIPLNFRAPAAHFSHLPFFLTFLIDILNTHGYKCVTFIEYITSNCVRRADSLIRCK